MKFICCLIFSCWFFGSNAQTGFISISINDENGRPVASASVILLKEKNIVRTSVADENGKVDFEGLHYGNYNCTISAINYDDASTGDIRIDLLNSSIVHPAITLKRSGTDLGAVTVTTKKPFIQKLKDRIVVNVDNSIISAGSSAFDVLEKSPGVTIDGNDAIALRGRQGVLIMIDGKPSVMSGADLVNYLRGLSANNIDRIEIITNPSSKYDAAGNSGIIDIKMKKDQRMGTNGNFTIGYGQGVYPKANSGLSINNRTKKSNLFASYNYSYRKGLNHLYLDRRFYENGIFKGADLKDNFTRFPINNHTLRLGADFFLSDKTIAGFVVNSNFTGFRRINANNSVVYDENYEKNFTFKTSATNNDKNINGVVNFNLKHTYKPGNEITVDADYGEYHSASLSRVGTEYFKVTGGSLQPDYILDGDQDGLLKFTTAKADYTHPLKKGAAIEAGFKTSFVSADNNAQFTDVSTGIPQNDENKTNHFIYKENNNAAYINYKRDFKKFDLQVGLRSEQTNVKTYQAIGNVKWDSSYIQLFPTAFFNYKLKEDKTIGISVSRRIDRPGYSQLNPFLFLIDVSTYSTGNPALLPQFTWSYELTYTLKQMNFSLSYGHTEKVQNTLIARFASVFPHIPLLDENVTVQIPVNLSSSDYAGFSASVPVKFTRWWNMVSNTDFYYNHFNGNLDGSVLDNGRPEANIRVNNTFTFKKEWSGELNGVFNSGGQYGFMVSEPQWGISAGVQKNILDKKGLIRLSVSDIFWTNLPRAVITYDNYVEKWHAQRESRVASLNFTYRFGKKTVQGARRRTTASEEERQRAG